MKPFFQLHSSWCNSQQTFKSLFHPRSLHAYHNWLHNKSHLLRILIHQSRQTISFHQRSEQNRWRVVWFVWASSNRLRKILHLSTEIIHRKRSTLLLRRRFRLFRIPGVNILRFILDTSQVADSAFQLLHIEFHERKFLLHKRKLKQTISLNNFTRVKAK